MGVTFVASDHLTDKAIRNAKPGSKPYKKADSFGLYLLVTPAGGKWWRFKYRFGGKENSLSLGTYPATSLKQAREKRDAAHKMIEAGIDPSAHRKIEKAKRGADTFRGRCTRVVGEIFRQLGGIACADGSAPS